MGLSTPDLITMLRSPSCLERATAAKYLIIYGTHNIEAIVDTLHTEREEVRYTAAWILGYIGNGNVVCALKTHLDDNAWAVRAVVVSALARIGGPEAVCAIERATSDGDKRVRLAARKALTRLKR